MKCNLLASGRTSLLLGQVLDRPYLQHMVEQLVGRGVQTIHVFLQRDEEGVRTLLGDGSRWGISVAYTLTGEEPSWGDLTSVPQTAGSELVLVKLKKYESGKFGTEKVLMDMAARREIEKAAKPHVGLG